MTVLVGSAEISLVSENDGGASSKFVSLSSLEVVRIMATRAGFKDVDVEDAAPGVKIRANYGPNGGSIAVKGESLADACRKMVEAIW
jgi:hypothetical protein